MDVKVKQAVILVGGKGTRLLPLTETKPKPILPVLEKPCLAYLIESLAEAGIEEIILACGYKSKLLEAAIGNGSDLGVSIEYSYEDEPLGTAGAVKLIESRLDDVFVVANGDVFADINVRGELEKHAESDAKITISLTSVKNPCEFGIVRLDENDKITEFKEKPKPEEVFSNLINAGVYVMNREVMQHVPENMFFDMSKDLFPIVMSEGKYLQGYVMEGTWRDVGRPSDLLGANLVMASKRYSDMMWGGKRLEGSDVRNPFYIGKDSEMIGTKAAATVILGHCSITDSKLTNTLVMNNCVIDGATLSNCILGEGCRVMKGATLSNCVLGDGTVVLEGEIMEDNGI
jgi:mannose-1-phosphate guanylyltransferase